MTAPAATSITGSDDSTSASSGLEARKARKLLARTSAPIKYLDVVTSVTNASLSPPPCGLATPGVLPVWLKPRSAASSCAGTLGCRRVPSGAPPCWLPAAGPSRISVCALPCAAARSASRAAGRGGGVDARGGFPPRVGLYTANTVGKTPAGMRAGTARSRGHTAARATWHTATARAAGSARAAPPRAPTAHP